MCGHHFPLGTMALLTTPESAATERICESFQSTISSGTVGRQLAGEKAMVRLVSLAWGQTTQRIIKNDRITDSTIPSILQDGFTFKQTKGGKCLKTGCRNTLQFPFSGHRSTSSGSVSNTLEGNVVLLLKSLPCNLNLMASFDLMRNSQQNPSITVRMV